MRPYLLPQAFERAAARWPQAPAVVAAAGEAWTYAELERASRGWARRLAAAGVAAGDRVGIWMPKSRTAVAALVGASRAGAVYVPLDPWAPAARVAALARDCGLGALVADAERAAAARAWAAPPATVLTLDAEDSGAPGEIPSPLRTGDDLAYLLYTSGSTGAPKGVMLTHAHAINFIAWAGSEAGLGPGDRVASHAPFHFDLSVFDLWATLSRGAAVCLLDPVTARFPHAVADWIVARAITVWYSVPSALVQLLPHAGRVAAGGLRTLLFAGEVFPATALRAWRRALPQVEFHNWYGPTETNVCAYYRLPPAAAGDPPDPLPIGRACPNFELTVWGEDRRPVEPGAAGFLWARGPGILAGYWGEAAPAAICERVPKPGAPTQRWYNTGDLARLGPDGELYFQGRRDHLVKCRGYRISLLEIERALEACPGVRQAAAVALPDAVNATRLEAFVLAAEPSGVIETELRKFLRERLPVYMLPERIEVSASLPVTSTGKLDRQRLPAWAPQAAGSS